MISAFLNTVKIPELRRRILYTLAVIVVVRVAGVVSHFVEPAHRRRFSSAL
jgi:preprotein translocase subunit SecY